MAGEVRVVFSKRLGPMGHPERPLLEHRRLLVTEAHMPDVAAVRSELRGAHVVVAGATEPLVADVLRDLPDLVLIVRRGVGLNNVDVDAATRLGISVAYVPDATVEEVSDHALALLLSAERRVVVMDRAVRAGAGVKARGQADPARRFGDMTLGVVGLGRIGRRLAEKASGVFGRIIGSDVTDVDVPGVERLELARVFSESDAVSLHLPLVESTNRLVGDELLSLCRSGTVLVNTSRGEVIDEAALLRALDAGDVAVAALDVSEQDPPEPGNPLLEHPSVVLTGHTAARGVRGSRELRERTVAAVIAAAEGLRPENLANPAAWGVRSLPEGGGGPG